EAEKQQQEANEAALAGSTIKVLKSAIVKKEDPAAAASSAAPPTKTKGKSRTRWHFGIRSRSPPFDIMLEIYRALRNCGMAWKPISAFHIRCRHVSASGCVVKVDIQLYKVEANSYLVDFKNASPNMLVQTALPSDSAASHPTNDAAASGPLRPADEDFVNLTAFAFFDACSRLIMELAISTT
ncbi:5-AMP-activated protein kinase, catalytic, partial [Cladochytrium tenue]